MQTYHACDHVINATITICPCTDNCKVCQEEEEKREYYDRRWQKNEDGYNVCGMCMKMLRSWAICEAWFCTRCKKEKKRYSSQKQKDLGSISVTCCSHTASYKEKERRLSTSYWKKAAALALLNDGLQIGTMKTWQCKHKETCIMPNYKNAKTPSSILDKLCRSCEWSR